MRSNIAHRSHLLVQFHPLADDVLVASLESEMLAAPCLYEVCEAIAGDTVSNDGAARVFLHENWYTHTQRHTSAQLRQGAHCHPATTAVRCIHLELCKDPGQ